MGTWLSIPSTVYLRPSLISRESKFRWYVQSTIHVRHYSHIASPRWIRHKCNTQSPEETCWSRWPRTKERAWCVASDDSWSLARLHNRKPSVFYDIQLVVVITMTSANFFFAHLYTRSSFLWLLPHFTRSSSIVSLWSRIFRWISLRQQSSTWIPSG